MTHLLLPISYHDPCVLTNQLPLPTCSLPTVRQPWPTCSNQSVLLLLVRNLRIPYLRFDIATLLWTISELWKTDRKRWQSKRTASWRVEWSTESTKRWRIRHRITLINTAHSTTTTTTTTTTTLLNVTDGCDVVIRMRQRLSSSGRRGHRKWVFQSGSRRTCGDRFFFWRCETILKLDVHISYTTVQACVGV